MGNTETDRRRSSLWDRILEAMEEDLAKRRAGKLAVRVRGESDPCEKKIGDLTPADLPALVEADRERAEEHRERRERAKFVRDMRPAVDQLQAGELAEMAEAPRLRRVA
jgi:hypothetical protein